MSKKEDRTLKLIIGTLLFFAFAFAYSAMKIEVASWGLLAISSLVFGAAFFAVFYRGHSLGCGKIAKESDLDANIVYRIKQTVVLYSGDTTLFLDESLGYETQVVVEPRREGFKKFEILKDGDHSYLVPKKLKAKIVDGRLWTPVK